MSRSAHTRAGVRSRISRYRSATRAARSDPYADVAGGLCAMARWNKPSARGTVISVVSDPPPDDSPNTVTRSGSPPNAEMQSRTHSSAAI